MEDPTLAARIRPRLLEALRLKELARSGWVRVGVPAPESVAAHSWGVAWLVVVLCPSELNRERALAMAVVHDLAEVRVGDLTPHDGVDPREKSARESAVFAEMTRDLPGAADLRALLREYEECATPEARFVKACDKLDMALQASRYALRDGVDTAEFVESALARIAEPSLAALISD